MHVYIYLIQNTTSAPMETLSTFAASTPINSTTSTNSGILSSSSSMGSNASSSSCCSSGSPIEIPSHWRPHTLQCISNKSLNTESRSDIVRSMVQMLTQKVGPRPTQSHCEQTARLLIMKYPFMKDPMGDGYVSDS